MDVADIFGRAKHALKTKGGTGMDKELADALGTIPVYIAQCRKRGTIPWKKLMEWCQREGVDANWLFFGEGREPGKAPKDRMIPVSFFQGVHGACGEGGEAHEDEIEVYWLDRRIVEEAGSRIGHRIEAIRAVGDSMEPTIRGGSMVIVDRNDTDARKGGVFVVNTVDDGLLIKRVALQGGNAIRLISDNKDLYSPLERPISEIEILGKVLGSFQRG